ncbi:MAG: glycosyltransferase [Blastocatellia bacterium]|nr:glycosyltransferase [Blastocatellia bacterium]
MKVVQATGWYFPESSGGTEVFVKGLTEGLTELGVEPLVCAPWDRETSETYQSFGCPVFRFPAPHLQNGSNLSVFETWLQEVGADLYHQHSWSAGCGVEHLKVAHRLGLKTILTVHVPGFHCLQGTMLRYGREVCDGRLDSFHCGACWAHQRGLPLPFAKLSARIPPQVGQLGETLLPGTQFTTAMGVPLVFQRFATAFQQIPIYTDRVVAVCQWLYDILALNGIPQEKLVLSRQGVAEEVASAVPESTPPTQPRSLQIGFLGRLDPVKGVHILIEAVAGLPTEVPVRLVIYGLPQTGNHDKYQILLKQLAAADPRIRFEPPVGRDRLYHTLTNLDVLAVPSQWLETGPLVVLEAQQAGVPILGANLGGIAELVKEGETGWLVSAADVTAWREAILRLATNPDCLTKLRTNPKPVRTMRQVAREMKILYDEVLEGDAPPTE